MEVTPDGSACFLMTESPERAVELWRISEEFRAVTPLRQLNPELEQVAFGQSSLVSWRDKRGETRKGALLLPPTYTEGRRVPMIVSVYGGEENARDIDPFGFRGVSPVAAHLLAAHGYAVLYPEMPMEGHEPMRQLPSLVRAAVRRVVALGIADPERLGMMGHSYGGYCVLALLTQTRLFRAGVCSAGIVDLIGVYSRFWNGINQWWAWAEQGQGRMGGTPWEKRQAYIRNSPFFFLDRVTAPVLLIAGADAEEDARQAQKAFGALRRLDRTVELRLYPGEGHWPGTWSANSVRDVSSRILTWFERHL
jgi:dipeptidyl aminopeptidase/acylaminoacyl peptidase